MDASPKESLENFTELSGRILLASRLAIIVGWKTRVVAGLLAGFSLLTAIAFHRNFADQAQMVNFLKNISIAGGLLLLVTGGAGQLSIDRRGAGPGRADGT